MEILVLCTTKSVRLQFVCQLLINSELTFHTWYEFKIKMILKIIMKTFPLYTINRCSFIVNQVPNQHLFYDRYETIYNE